MHFSHTQYSSIPIQIGCVAFFRHTYVWTNQLPHECEAGVIALQNFARFADQTNKSLRLVQFEMVTPMHFTLHAARHSNRSMYKKYI